MAVRGESGAKEREEAMGEGEVGEGGAPVEEEEEDEEEEKKRDGTNGGADLLDVGEAEMKADMIRRSEGARQRREERAGGRAEATAETQQKKDAGRGSGREDLQGGGGR